MLKTSLVALLWLGGSVVEAQVCAGTLAERVAAEVGEIQQQQNVAGMAVAIVVEGKQFVYPFGVRAKDSQQPVTGDTIFELGSISKVFTSLLVGYAQAQGKLDLTAPASRYWPELAGSAFDKVTVAELATYTPGGLPLQFPEEVEKTGDLLSYLRGWKPVAAPGTQRQYSNPSIGLAGYLAARSLGKPFADLMEGEVLAKLGLSDTYVRVPEKRMGDYAWGYNSEGKAVRVTPGVLDAQAYGIKTTARQMGLFLERMMEPGRIGDGQLRQAVGVTRSGYFQVGGMTQGLGWEMYDWPVGLEGLVAGNSPKVVFEANPVRRLTPVRAPVEMALHNKTGSTNGFGAYVAMVPGKKMGVALLANRNYPIPARLGAAHRLLKRVEECGGR
jgi:beta-lactamase class C